VQQGFVDMILGLVTALLALAIVIAMFGIVNTLALAVFERTREIGLLRAVGMSRRQLRRMIRLESVIIAVFGAVLGWPSAACSGGRSSPRWRSSAWASWSSRTARCCSTCWWQPSWACWRPCGRRDGQPGWTCWGRSPRRDREWGRCPSSSFPPVTDRAALRLFVLRVVVLAILATLFGRLWFLQVYAARTTRRRPAPTASARWSSLRRAGRSSTPAARRWCATARAGRVGRPGPGRAAADGGQAVLRRLGEVLGRPAELLAQEVRPCGGGVRQPCWRGSPYQPVPVASFDARDPAGLARVLAVEERREDFPGVRAQFAAVREHPQGTLAAHVLGYLGPISPEEVDTPPYDGVQPSALIGRAGVEATYDRALRGEDGVTGCRSTTSAR
jgi:hypothetical protein